MRQRLSAKVANEKDSRTDTMAYCENPHHRDNVNVAQGPRTGNAGAHDAKRANFKAAKEERRASALAIEQAYGARQLNDYAEHDFPEDGSIGENSHIRQFKNSRKF